MRGIMSGSLEIFNVQWPDFVKKIHDADTSKIKECYTKQNEINFLINDQYVHSQNGALKEAERLFHSLPIHKELNTLFIYGIGAGYVYLAAKRWLEENPNRLLFFFEDDFALLSKFLETDLSHEVINHRQVIVVPFDSIIKTKEIHVSYDLEMLLYSVINASYHTAFSVFYASFREEFCKAFSQFIHFRIADFKWSLQFSYLYRVSRSFQNQCRNLLMLPGRQLGGDLFGKFTDIPVVICAAGPSIQEQLPQLKRMKNRALFFGAGTGMNTLNQGGILAHFGCGIDPNQSSESRMRTNTAYETPYFYTSDFYDKAAELLHGPQLFFSKGKFEGFTSWFIEELELNVQTPVPFILSTTCACMVLSNALACNPIIFIGVDLSYTEEKRYIDGVQAHPADTSRENFEIKNLPEENLVRMKNFLGNTIYSRIDWISEATYYRQYVLKHPKLKFINVTREGISLGMPQKTLDDLLDEDLLFGYDFENWVHAEVVSAQKVELNVNDVYQTFELWKISLESSKEILINMSKELLEVDEKLTAIPESLETKIYLQFKELFEQEPAYRYFLKRINKTFIQLSVRERLGIRYHKESYSQEELYEKELEIELIRLKFLYDYAHAQAVVIEEFLEEKVMDLEGSFVKNRGVKEAGYYFEQGIFSIEDSEIDLHYDDEFSPKFVNQVPEKIENESQRFFASFENGIPDGECVMYDLGGWLKARWYYKNGKLHGPSTFYTKGGNLLARGWFIEDVRQGINQQYYPSGQLYSIERYRDGILEGNQEYYYENGSLKTHFHYSKGFLEGTVQLFYSSGKIKRELNFQEGIPFGIEKSWSPDGCLILETEHKSGNTHGKVRSWYKNGQLKMEKVYFDDPSHFDLRKWGEDGQLIYEKLYVPKKLSDESLEKGIFLSEAVQQLKEKVEGLNE